LLFGPPRDAERYPSANVELSTEATLVLNDIFSLLLPIASKESHPARSLAQEARLVITARLASTSVPRRPPTRSTTDKDPQAIYQKALKLLQDPILPVRAHGLLLLRQLVSTTPHSNDTAFDRALVPAILSIFLQSIQDEDSYLFLNAVQGLAAMVDAFGKDVLKGVVNEYTRASDGLGITNLTQRELDTRLRVGEALGQVIRRSGEALTAYGEVHIGLSKSPN
jgi:Required for nuclear transport of RNA pol II C-terminus 1